MSGLSFYFLMKKVIFYIAVIIAVIFLVNVINILVNDLSRLTEYGYGYLAGKIILFFAFGALAYFTRPKKVKA